MYASKVWLDFVAVQTAWRERGQSIGVLGTRGSLVGMGVPDNKIKNNFVAL